MSLNFRKRFTEFVLIFLIFLNFWDFLGPWFGFISLPGDGDFFKKILSWAIIAHFFYEVSFTWLLFGKKQYEKSGIFSNRLLDLGILSCFLLFAMKQLIGVSNFGVDEVYYTKELVQYLAINGMMIETLSFYIAGIGLLLISLYMTFYTDISKKSLLGNLGFHNRNWLVKFVGIFFILTSFYILVFDLIIEWLAIAVDSSIIILGVLVYIFLIAKFHKRFSAESLIFKIGSYGEDFEGRILKYFHDEKHIFLGFSGLLVLHLLTEISNFLLPYFGLTNSFYFAKMGLNPLYGVIRTEFFLDKLVIFGYILNIIAILGLVIIPAVFWYEVYKNKHGMIHNWILSIFLGSLIFFLLNPLFKFEALNYKIGFVGVGIISKSLLIQDLGFTLMIAGITMLVLFLLSFIDFLGKIIYHVTVLSVIAFFGYYLYLFYWSTGQYFVKNILSLYKQSMWFFLFFFFIFFFVKALFVLVSFSYYVIQLNKKHLV